MLKLLALIAALSVTGSAWSADLTVSAAWSRATAPTAPTGAIFLTITNAEAVEDRLISAACAAAEVVELHTHTKDDQGVMRMRPVPAITVPANGSAELKPGADHVMLIGLKKPLVAGEKLELTLTFANAGAIPVLAKIQAIDATAAPTLETGGCCPLRAP